MGGYGGGKPDRDHGYGGGRQDRDDGYGGGKQHHRDDGYGGGKQHRDDSYGQEDNYKSGARHRPYQADSGYHDNDNGSRRESGYDLHAKDRDRWDRGSDHSAPSSKGR